MTERKKSEPILTCEQCRRIDRFAVERWGVPSLLLMENAGRSLVDVFRRETNDVRRVLICCGKGNNGGDGFVMARRLELEGIPTETLTLGTRDSYRGDAAVNINILTRMGDDSDPANDERLWVFDGSNAAFDRLSRSLDAADWVVDALLGTGFSGSLRFPTADLIARINSSGKPVFAVDIPSGLDGDRGTVADVAVRAKITCSLAALKTGIVAPCAESFVGKVVLGDIGVPVERLLNEIAAKDDDNE